MFPSVERFVQGKYEDSEGGSPEARLNKYKGRYAEAESRYGPRPEVRRAVRAYVALARQAGVTPTCLALRYGSGLGFGRG